MPRRLDFLPSKDGAEAHVAAEALDRHLAVPKVSVEGTVQIEEAVVRLKDNTVHLDDPHVEVTWPHVLSGPTVPVEGRVALESNVVRLETPVALQSNVVALESNLVRLAQVVPVQGRVALEGVPDVRIPDPVSARLLGPVEATQTAPWEIVRPRNENKVLLPMELRLERGAVSLENPSHRKGIFILRVASAHRGARLSVLAVCGEAAVEIASQEFGTTARFDEPATGSGVYPLVVDPLPYNVRIEVSGTGQYELGVCLCL